MSEPLTIMPVRSKLTKVVLTTLLLIGSASPCVAGESEAIAVFPCLKRITSMSEKEFREARTKNECFLSTADVSAAQKKGILWLGTVRPLPVRKEGRVEGVRFHEIKRYSLFRCLLLETGDTLLQVNQETIDPLLLTSFFLRLQQGEVLNFEVDRNGTVVNYPCSVLEK